MKTFLRVRQALDILSLYSPGSPGTNEGHIADNPSAYAIIFRAREVLLKQAGEAITSLTDLGFSKKEISQHVGFDESIISRASDTRNDDQSRRNELSLGFEKLRRLVERLQDYIPIARNHRLGQILLLDPPPSRVLDFCLSQPLSEQVCSEINQTVLQNLSSYIAGNIGERRSLPPDVPAALIQLGPASDHIFAFQADGASDVEKLKHAVHETKHILSRLQAKLARLEQEQSGGRSLQRAKSRARF